MWFNNVQPSVGFQPAANYWGICVNRTGGAVVAGEVLQLDTGFTDAATTTSRPGETASCWANVVDPVTPDPWGFYVIALEAAADDAEFKCLGIGYTDLVTVTKATDNIAIGDVLQVSNTDNDLDITANAAAPTSGDRIVGFTGAAVAATSGTPTIFFDGLSNAFGIAP